MKKTYKFLTLIALIGFAFLNADAQKLEGEWKLTEAISNGEKVVYKEESRTTLSFFASDKLGGNAGCNRYSASFKTDGKKIEFSPVISTKMACEGERMKQETTFFGVIGKISRFEFDGEHLILTDEKDANVLKFTPVGKTNSEIDSRKKCRDKDF